MPQFEFTGLAVRTALQSGIGSGDTTIVIQDGTGWPTGAANPFIATIGDKEAGQAIEKILVTARTGDAPATLSGVTRAHEGVAQAWGPNTQIRHTISAAFVAELSAHVHDDTRDDHGQYHNATRHAAVLHTAAMLGPDSVGNDELADLSVGTLNIQDLAVTTPKIANLGVTEPKLADDAVVARVIADGAIDDHVKFSADTQPFIVQAGDPGAVGANRIWFDTTTRQIKIRNAANTAWVVYGEAIEPWQDYAIAFGGVTLGTGADTFGRYTRTGDTVLAYGGFALGVGGNVTALITASLPYDSAVFGTQSAKRFPFPSGAWAFDVSQSGQWAAVGTIDTTSSVATVRSFGTAGATSQWDATSPFPWDPSDHMHFFVAYETSE